MHHLDSWIKIDQLDTTCFIISLFNTQHVSDVNTSILWSLRLICWVISWVVLFWFDVCWCYIVVWLGWCGILMQSSACTQIPHHNTNTQSNQSNTTHEITQQISRKLLRMDVLTSETCWALNNEIIKQMTSSWSVFIQLYSLIVYKLVQHYAKTGTVKLYSDMFWWWPPPSSGQTTPQIKKHHC